MAAEVIIRIDEYGETRMNVKILDALLLAAATRAASKNDTELARAIGVSRMTLHTWRTDRRRPPSQRHLAMILRAAGFEARKSEKKSA